MNLVAKLNINLKSIISFVISAVLIFTVAPVRAQSTDDPVFISCSEAILRGLGVAMASCGSESNEKRCGVNENGGNLTSNKVFYIGDSLTVGMVDQGNLLSATGAAGFSTFTATDQNKTSYNGSPRRTGRSVEAIQGINVENVIAPLQEHQNDYNAENAGVIVVGLGTNPENNFKRKVKDLHRAIREDAGNETAQIYWVNVYVEDEDFDYESINAELEEAVSELENDIKIIDFAREAESNPSIYPFAGDGIHHSTEGYTSKVQFVLDNLPNGSQDALQSVVSEAINLDDTQKIAQTFILGFNGGESEEMKQIAEKYKIGGVFILGDDNDAYKSEFFDNINTATGIPLIVASDEEGGNIQRFEDFIGSYPSAKELGTKENEEVTRIGKQVGEGLKSRGVNMNLAPVVDIDDEISGAIHDLERSFSSNPDTVAEKADAFAKGLKNAGITPTYKHWPGLGTTPGNTDNGEESSPSLSDLEERDLKAFDPIINNNGAFVMLSNAEVPGLTEEDYVVGYSPEAVNYLRNTSGFTGLITTDDLDASGVPIDTKDAVARSLNAGVNMPLFKYNGESDLLNIIETVKESGYDPESNLEKIVGFKDATFVTPGNLCGPKRSGDNYKDAILILKQYMTLEQAVGVVANMHHESGVVPARIQWVYGTDTIGARNGVSLDLIGEGLSVSSAVFEEAAQQIVDYRRSIGESDPSAINKIGWGLVQWTDAFKMLNPSRETGASAEQIDSMEYQIAFLIGQLTGEDVDDGNGNIVPGSTVPEIAAGDHLFDQVTAEDAAESFANKYERCAECQAGESQLPVRRAKAAELMVKYGNL